MNILFFFKSVFLIIFGVAVTNILHFYVEDLFLDHSVRSWIFGSSYGLSAAWMLITGLAFFAGHLLQQRFCTFDDAYFKARSRYYFVFALLCVFTFMSAFYVVKVVANFLEGYDSVASLLRALITIIFFAGGALYAFMEMKKGEIVATKPYVMGLSLGVGLLTVMGMTIFLFQASPSQMRIARQDAQKVRTIKMIDDRMQGLYRKKGELPQSIEALMPRGTSGDQAESSIQGDYDYKVIDSSTFEICTTLHSKKSLFERGEFSFQGLARSYFSGSLYPTLHYFPGHRCEKVKLTLEDEVSAKGKPYKKVSAFYNFKGNLYTK